MSRPQVRIYTGEGEFIDREMNDEEYEQYLKDVVQFEEQRQQEIQIEAKRQSALAKLAALGLEEDDLKALGL